MRAPAPRGSRTAEYVNPEIASCRASTGRPTGPTARNARPAMPEWTSWTRSVAPRSVTRASWDTPVTSSARTSAASHAGAPIRRSDDGDGVEHRAGRALDLQRQGDEEELVHPLAGDLLQIHRLEEVDGVLDEQQGVHRLRVGRRARVGGRLHLERLGVAAHRDHALFQQPARRADVRSGGDVAGQALRVGPLAQVAGPDEDDVPR